MNLSNELVRRALTGDPDAVAETLADFLQEIAGKNVSTLKLIETIGGAFIVMTYLQNRAAFAGAITTIRMLMLANPHASIDDIMKGASMLLKAASSELGHDEGEAISVVVIRKKEQ